MASTGYQPAPGPIQAQTASTISTEPTAVARIKRVTATVGLLIAAFVSSVPFYYMLNLALQEKGGYGLFDWPPRMVPEWPLQLHNFPDSLSQSPFGLYFLNSTIIAVLSMAGTVLSSSIAGYVFARMRFPGRDVLFIVMLATLMVPPQVTLIPQFILFKSLGWYDSWYPLWVPHWTGTAFAIFLMRQYFKTLPSELVDAAKIDGANPPVIFWRIFLPLAKPVLATVAILIFLGSWNDLLGPVIYLQSNDNYTVQVGLAFFRGQYTMDVVSLMSASVVAVIPPIVVFMLTQRYFVRGIVLTGLKG